LVIAVAGSLIHQDRSDREQIRSNLRLEDPTEHRKVERTAGIRSDFLGIVFRSGVEARHSVPDLIGSEADHGGSADPIEAREKKRIACPRA
jgi:hypothetical protein